MAELKAGWQRVKFGEVVRLNKETCKDPEAADIDRVIGLEHLEPGDLRVRSWADVADGTTFTKRVRPGQVLFGKRRAYQRKVAVADFDAVCSGDIYALESADPERLMPELLPFICQTDAFFEYAVGTSAGSLSPRTNWKSLATYEFALPPCEVQKRIQYLLKATYQALDAAREAANAAKIALQATMLEVMENRSKNWQIATLDTMVSRFIDYRGRTPRKTKSGVPLITAKNVRDGFLDFSEPEWIASEDYEAWMTRGIPNEGDILLTTEAPLGLVAKAPQGKFALAQRIICLQPESEINPAFLFWAIRSYGFQREIRKKSTGTTVNGIKQSVLRQIPVRLPSLDDQAEVVMAIENAAESVRLAEESFAEIARLTRSIRTFIF
jgi:type I restriction enzyme S subunit